MKKPQLKEIHIKDIVILPKEIIGKKNEKNVQVLMNAISEVGLLNPITVWERADSTLMVISGKLRIEAFKRLNKEKIDAAYYEHGQLTEDEANKMMIRSNETGV